MRNAGTKKSWMTSSEVIRSFTGLPSGTWSSLISRFPSGCWIFHIHCLPTTVYCTAFAGGLFCAKKTFAPQTKRLIRRRSGMPDQPSSRTSFVFSSVTSVPICAGLRRRYFTANVTTRTAMSVEKKTAPARA